MTKTLLALTLLAAPAFADPGGKPPSEIGDVAKLMTGTWKCDGTIPNPGKAPFKLKATVKSEPTLDGFWIHETVEVGVPGAVVREEAYMTFDGKKWQRFAFDNMGGHETGSADAMKGGKLDWTMDVSGVPERVHLDVSDPKKGLHLSSELSKDKGKTWAAGPDMTCAK